MARRRPFALVRLGDGEGGVLRLDGKDEADYGHLYDQNRQDLIAMWFGQSFPWWSCTRWVSAVPSLVNAVHALLAHQGAPRRFVS